MEDLINGDFVKCPYCDKYGDFHKIGERKTFAKQTVFICQCGNCERTFCLQIKTKYKTKKIISAEFPFRI